MIKKYALTLPQSEKDERKEHIKQLRDMTPEEHDADILRVGKEKHWILEIAQSFDINKNVVRTCAIRARETQKKWWLEFGGFWKHGFGTREEALRLARKLRQTKRQLDQPDITNRLQFEAARSAEDTLLADADIAALDRIAKILERSAKQTPKLANARCDLRLMHLAPRALWNAKSGRSLDYWEFIRRGSDHDPSTRFIFNVLRMIDPSVTLETVQNIDTGLGDLAIFGLKDWKQAYEAHFEEFSQILAST